MWRRVAAATLCACFMVPLCRPLLRPDSEASLPACCRRNGKHHCAMMARYLALKQQQEGKPGFGSAPEPCPYRAALFPPTALQFLGAPRSLAFYVGLESHPAILAFARIRARVSPSRSDYKRGPPALL